MKRLNTWLLAITMSLVFLASEVQGQNCPFNISTVCQNCHLCFDGTNGKASVSVWNGLAPYSYIWSDGQTNTVATGLSTGFYYVTVTDATGCITIHGQAVQTIPNPINSPQNIVMPERCSGKNGAIMIIIPNSSGISRWYNANGDSIGRGIDLSQSLWGGVGVSNLEAGNYTLIYSENGCIDTSVWVVPQITDSLSISSNHLYYDCLGHGSVKLTKNDVSSSTGWTPLTYTPSQNINPITFEWGDQNNSLIASSLSTSSLFGLTGGIYTLTVTDHHRCQGVLEFTIAPEILISLTIDLINGTANAGLNGGIGHYSYLWSNGQTDSTVTGLTAGTYTVTVTDANGCIGTDSFTFSPTVTTGLIGSESNDIGEVRVYPNPTNGLLYVTSTTDQQVMELRLYDLLGRMILITNTPEMNLAVLPAEIYILEVVCTNGHMSRHKVTKS